MKEIHQKINEIIDTDSDERIMVFTENKELMELAAQINRLLENHMKVKASYRRFELASKRMLSNISHDMKTPMTVILGYLEIMRLSGEATPEMLAKIETGDMDLELSRVDLCEIYRESILDFYEILTKADFQVDIELPEGPVRIQGNQEALQRILFNLISNVIRYGSEGK